MGEQRSHVYKGDFTKVDNIPVMDPLQAIGNILVENNEVMDEFSITNDMHQERRNLADSGLSILTSTLTVASYSITSGSSVVFTLQGRDSSGNNLSTGGETINLIIVNQCSDFNQMY